MCVGCASLLNVLLVFSTGCCFMALLLQLLERVLLVEHLGFGLGGGCMRCNQVPVL